MSDHRKGISIPLIARLNRMASVIEDEKNNWTPQEVAKEMRMIAAWIEGAAPEWFNIQMDGQLGKPSLDGGVVK